MRNAECGTRNAERGMRNAECGMRNKIQMKSRSDMDMKTDELRTRTKAFALRIIRLAESLPDHGVGRVIQGQILRCGTSVGANR